MAHNPSDPVLYKDNEIDYGSKNDGREIAKDTEYAGEKETLRTLKVKIRVNAMKGQGNTAPQSLGFSPNQPQPPLLGTTVYRLPRATLSSNCLWKTATPGLIPKLMGLGRDALPEPASCCASCQVYEVYIPPTQLSSSTLRP